MHWRKSIIAEKAFELDGKSVFKEIIAKSEQLRNMDDDGEVYENGQVSDFYWWFTPLEKRNTVLLIRKKNVRGNAKIYK